MLSLPRCKRCKRAAWRSGLACVDSSAVGVAESLRTLSAHHPKIELCSLERSFLGANIRRPLQCPVSNNASDHRLKRRQSCWSRPFVQSLLRACHPAKSGQDRPAYLAHPVLASRTRTSTPSPLAPVSSPDRSRASDPAGPFIATSEPLILTLNCSSATPSHLSTHSHLPLISP